MPFLLQPSQFILPWDRHRNMLDCIPHGLVNYSLFFRSLIKRLNEWKNNVENRGMGVNMNKTKFMISGER